MYILFIISSGLLIGSFLNVVIYRLPRKESVVFPRSHCQYCEKELGVLDLLPVVSYILLKGKCRYCGARISWQYPLVELMTAIILLILYYTFGFTTLFYIYSLLTLLLIPSAVIDLKHQIIPNKITYPGIIIGILLALFFDHISIVNALLGLIIPALFLLILAIIFKGGMGMGDVKLVAMIGVFLGASYTMVGIFIGAVLGSIYGVYVFLKNETTSFIGMKIPFGIFIALGNLVMIFQGNRFFYWYFNLL